MTYISILRGINVSGKNKILMTELKAMYAGLGYENVQTYIQSGNVIFTTKGKTNAKTLIKDIESAIKQNFNFDVPVIIRTKEEWSELMHNNPYLHQKNIDPAYLHVTFLADPPEKDIVVPDSGQYAPDSFILSGKEVYLHCPGGYGNTKLHNNFFEKKLKTGATTRNWKTVLQLAELAQ